MGNLLFDHASKRSGCWTEGYMVSIDFQKEKISFELTPYKQCTEDAVGVLLMNTEEKEIFAHKIQAYPYKPRIHYNNADDGLLQHQHLHQ